MIYLLLHVAELSALVAATAGASGAECSSQACREGGFEDVAYLQRALKTSQLTNPEDQDTAVQVGAASAVAAAEEPDNSAEDSARGFNLMNAASRLVERMLDGLNKDFDPFTGHYSAPPPASSPPVSMESMPPAPATGSLEKDVPPGAPAMAAPSNATATAAGEMKTKGEDKEEKSEEAEDTHERVHHTWHKDAFDADEDVHPSPAHILDGDEGLNFFRAASTRQWVALIVFCLFSFIFDLLVLQRLATSFRSHMACIGVWLVAAAIFNGWIFATMGETAAVEWTSGYFLEWMLSMDNLFVFHLIFKKYKTPSSQVHYAVFVGIFGALLLRMCFFMVLSTLLHLFHWIRLPFGALLIWSGIETAYGEDEEEEVQDLLLVRGLRKCLGGALAEEYDEKGGLFRWSKEGRLQATLLLIVVFCLEATDVLFALDSVSAKVAQIPNQYLAFSSSVIAMFGLRAMFFIIEDLVDMFHLLAYGLCLILIFIGVQLIFAKWLHLPASTVCILILSVFAVCIAGSWVTKKPDEEHEEAAEAK